MKLSKAKMLYTLLRQNQKTAMRRHPMFERNKLMKYLGYLFVAFWAVYLIVIGFMLSKIQTTGHESFDITDGGMIVFLILDFLMRFALQETPAQETKPYKLMPIPQKFLLNVFLLRMGISAGNCFWGFCFVPFGLLSVYGFYGLTGFASYLLGWWLVFVANSYYYLLWRSYIQRNAFWAICPLVIYALLIYFGYLFDENNQWLFKATLLLGRGFCEMKLWSFVIPIAVIIVLFFVNRKIQYACIYKEIAKTEKTPKVKSSSLPWLDRFGIIGEYLKLEIKSSIRNKVVRAQFLNGICFMCLFCFAMAFLDVYDSSFMRIFICVYCFACMGTMTLTSILCIEGNYMDLLLSRKESVLQLLQAKYWWNCSILIIPILFTQIPVVEGKFLPIEPWACCFFTTGCIYPFLFQLAVYNDTTLHPNSQVTKSGRSTKTQIIFSGLALFVPMIVMYALEVLISPWVASCVLLVLGLLGTICSPYWLRNIYNRFMLRRYDNMNGFRATRSA